MKRRALTQSGSTFLDVVRFGAAFVVFLGHLGAIIPSAAQFTHLAHIAVCIFFVLSGFIIRMVVTNRVTTMKDFLIDRASRIYSVAIPALALTLLCAALSTLVNPAGWGVSEELSSWSHVPLQVLTNLTFTAQIWGYETVPIFNSPFWSLSFECIYYLLFALMFFRWDSKSVRVIFFLLLFAAGPAIVFLFPIWLLGCLLYDVYLWLDDKPYAWLLTSCLFLAVMLFAIFNWAFLGHLLVVTDLPHRTAWLQGFFSPSARHFFADSTGEVPWLLRASFSFYIAGIISSVSMLWALVTIDRFCPKIPRSIATTIRWVAEGTFALYLLHLPLILLTISLSGGHPIFPYATTALIGTACIVASRWFDRLKTAMRQRLHRAFPARAKAI